MGMIFDMDGVLINSNAAHFASWLKVAGEDGVVFTEEIFWRTFGMTSEHIVEQYWRPGLDAREVAEIVERKETAFRESILDCVQPIEGSVDFVRYLVGLGVKVALGSSAPRVNVDYVVDWLGAEELFGDRVVAGDEVSRGKPAPDVFLLAADKLHEPPERCFVVDDSRSGVTAGKAAGMTTIGFFSEGHRADEYERADAVVRNFTEFADLLNVGEGGVLSVRSNPSI